MLYRNYLNEIEKLKKVAQLQYDDELITIEEFNDILFTLFDKAELYKRNIMRVKIPKINVDNYKNINIIQVTESLFCLG